MVVAGHIGVAAFGDFQYSLCRVVLMVVVEVEIARYTNNFQYSLCRVVLMVLILLFPKQQR